jgi:predicted PurR-regulated permease PerM
MEKEEITENVTSAPSPRWNASVKLVVALTLLAIVAGLLIKFESILSPLLIVMILAYLLHPVASFVSSRLHLSWRLAVSLIYGVMIITLLVALTLGGLGLLQQIQSLIAIVEENLKNLPAALADISSHPLLIGPFMLDLRTLDLGTLGNQLLGTIQSVIGQSGVMVSAVAGGAANFLSWSIFVLLVSFLVLTESNGLTRGFLHVNIPGYEGDLERLRKELANIWNAFLRGQIIIMALAAVIYIIVLSTLGVNYAVGLALLAGLARFVPYIGSFTVWGTLFLVTIFQPFKPFDMAPWAYALLVVGLAWLIDMIVDNFVAPRIMASALKVHPAAVLVAAIIGLGLLGILGIIIAAPLLATLQLIGRYFIRKLFDLDPWAGLEEAPAVQSTQGQFTNWFNRISKRLTKN